MKRSLMVAVLGLAAMGPAFAEAEFRPQGTPGEVGPATFPAFGSPLPPGMVERHATLNPTLVERLAGSTVRTTFDGGITHVGGVVSQMRVTMRLLGGRLVGVALEAVPADQGYATPEAYDAAGRDVTRDLALLLGTGTTVSASPGQTVQSGCSKIDVEAHFYAYGCYTRKLAQDITNGEILGETGQVTCRSRYYDMSECGNELRHAWVDDRAYISQWAPPSDQTASSCATKTWSLSYAGVGYSQSTQQCPTEYRMDIRGDANGATFRNSWFGKVRAGVNRSAAVVDTYRWQVPAHYRGSMRYVVVVDTSPGATKTCSGTCTTR